MGKRSDYVRRERDAYFTPIAAAQPLIDHLPKADFTYIEPCAGDGRLVQHISELTNNSGKCFYKSGLRTVKALARIIVAGIYSITSGTAMPSSLEDQ